MTDLVLTDVAVSAEAHDFELRSPHAHRWAGNLQPTRRALVHGYQDELVINYGPDYSGGIRLKGDVHLEGVVRTDATFRGDVTVAGDVSLRSTSQVTEVAAGYARALSVHFEPGYGDRHPTINPALQVNPDGRYERLILKGAHIRLEGTVSVARDIVLQGMVSVDDDLRFTYGPPDSAFTEQTTIKELALEVRQLRKELDVSPTSSSEVISSHRCITACGTPDPSLKKSRGHTPRDAGQGADGRGGFPATPPVMTSRGGGVGSRSVRCT